MSLLLTACSTNGNNNAANSKTDTNTGTYGEETYHAIMAIPLLQGEPKDMQLVEDELNKLVKEKINVSLDLIPISIGNWTQQTNLMLSSGEKLDLLLTGTGTYASQAATGKIIPIDELLKGPGKGVAEALGEKYISATKISGKVYGVSSIHDLAQNYSYAMRKDLVDKYKIDTTDIKTLDDVEKVLQIIKENEPNLTPIVPGGAGSSVSMLVGYNQYDLLGDGVGVLMDRNELKVTNLYESSEYKAFLTKFHDWYTKGYILRDAATNQIVPNQLVKAGKVFSYLTNGKPGFDAQESRAAGMEMVSAELNGPTVSTNDVTGFMWAIARNSENAEKAMEVLNLFYTDKEVINLINWGIEGKHYQKVKGDIIDFAPGVDATNTGYMPNWDWLTGNTYLSYIYKGGDPEIWEKTKEFNDTASPAKALGFIFNIEPVKNEYTAIMNVTNQYKVGLESGTLDPEVVLPQFIEKLKEAGIDKVIAEKQKQLDEWAQANNVK
ncbi:ABC transporter substrate-binding protein [Paenibacillus segetis]|uniref:ABC transporter substrate-binding protein n=1 Tax=Paenibacillus segetis TaxID=1325360 RepID=A0ABQ1YT24_9BACL|nr:ABC transporter substrate-binding protein [Paenibacillus segetis]GGH35061.1 ABC transporter substrate-binding protein [Paenibacillus segetis]